MGCGSRSDLRAVGLLAVLLAGCREPDAPPPAAPVRAGLVPGQAVEAPLKGGQSHSYRLDLTAGQYAEVVIEQHGVDVAVTLYGPDGGRAADVDSPNGDRGPEPLAVIAAASGGHRLEIRAPDAAAGRYAARLVALRLPTPRDHTRVAAERLFSRGEELRLRGDRRSTEAALAREEEALALFRAAGARDREADVLSCLALARLSQGSVAAAAGAYQEALEIFRALGDERRAGLTLNNLAQAYFSIGRPRQALASYEEALPLLRGTGEGWGEAAALSGLGHTYTELGETEKALASTEQALAAWRRLGRREEAAITLANRGSLYTSLGEPDRALDDLRQALPVLAAKGWRREEASALSYVGVAQVRAGRPRRGLPPFRRALELYRQIGDHRQEAIVLQNLGWLHGLLGEPAQARQALGQALAILREVVGDRVTEAGTLTVLGDVEAGSGRPREAAALYRQALPLLVAAGDRGSEADAWLGLSRALRDQGDLAGAVQAAEAALHRVEILRRTPASPDLRATFMAARSEYHELYIDLLMRLHRREPAAGHDGRALAASEEARARSLLEMLAEADTPSADLAQPRPLDLRQIQEQVVDDDTLLLEYSLGEERSFLWAVTPGSLTTFELPPRPVIEAASRRAAGLLAASRQRLARSQTDRALAELSRLVLAPAASLLKDHRLLVVADGALLYIPFGALPDPAGAAPLAASHEIVTLPSASTLATLRRRPARRPDQEVAVVADPVFSAADPRVKGARSGSAAPALPRLAFSRTEAAAILALAPAGQSFEALDFAASRATVLSGALARYRIVHFATHAVLDTSRPERSGVALSMVDAAGRPRDGFLRAPEIYGLHLPADLVVLSGCETALGREIRGEGLVGLTRGFLYAGARGVLVSLWPVEDRATAEWMRHFYTALLRRGLPPAAALRSAQEAMRRQPGREAPYYWSGFVLQGDWRAAPSRPAKPSPRQADLSPASRRMQ